jgi:RNA polymerase sigma-70 factor (ECF subfamily)
MFSLGQSPNCSEPQALIPENWVESCRPQLLAYGMSKLPFDVAEDLTQDTLLTAMQRLDTFCGQGKFEHWLWAILRRKMLDYWRRQKRSHTSCSDHLEFLLSAETTSISRSSFEDPYELLELAELGRVIEQALDELPKNQNSVMRLSRDSHLPATEIARELFLSVPNVWVSLHRARKHLKERDDQYVTS